MNVKDDVSTNWKMFKEAWCYYVTATELNKKPKEVQAGALCSVMGMDCVKVMNSLTTLTASDKKDPEKILSALTHCLRSGFYVVLTMQLKKIISLLLFAVPYKAIPHWKGQKLNFQKKNISVSGNP